MSTGRRGGVFDGEGINGFCRLTTEIIKQKKSWLLPGRCLRSKWELGNMIWLGGLSGCDGQQAMRARLSIVTYVS